MPHRHDRPSRLASTGRWPAWALLGCTGAVLAFFAWRGGVRAGNHLGDFGHFYWAAVAARQGTDLYASGVGGYVYPPLLAVLFEPLTLLGEQGGAFVWAAILAGLIAASLRIGAGEMVRRFGARRDPTLVAGAMFLALLLSFEEVRWELGLLQTDGILLLAFAAALRWIDRRPIAAGAVLGLAANIKYLSLVALPYLILRRRWRAAGSTAGFAVALALLPGLALGWGRNLEYLGRAGGGLAVAAGVSDRSADAANTHELAWHRSVSIPSAMARGAEALGLGWPWAAAGVVVVGAAIVAIAGVMYRRRGFNLLWAASGDADAEPAGVDGAMGALTAIEWLGLIVAATAMGPQATHRHMVLLLLPNTLAALLALGGCAGIGRRPIVGGMIVQQLGIRLPPASLGLDASRRVWQAIGGTSWCLLVMYFSLLSGALGRAAALRDGGTPREGPSPGSAS